MTAPIIPSHGHADFLMSLLRGLGSDARGTLSDAGTALLGTTPEEAARPASSRGGTRAAGATRPNTTRAELLGAAGRTTAAAGAMLAGEAAGALLRRTILGALAPRALKVAPKAARVARDASSMEIPVRGALRTSSPRQEAFDAFLNRILRHEDIPIDKGAFTDAAKTSAKTVSTNALPADPAYPGIRRIEAKIGDRVVGFIHAATGEEGTYAGHVFVEPEYRRLGIATKLYGKAEELLGKKLRPSPYFMTSDAQKFWASRK